MLFPLYDYNPHRRFPWITLLLIAVNVGVMIWLTAMPRNDANRIALRYGFVPVRVTDLGTGKPVMVHIPELDRWGKPTGREIEEKLADRPDEIYLTFFTMMFLHGSWLHLGFNMWMLWVFGNNIEDRLGPLMYLCYYLVGGLIGTFAHWAVSPLADIPVIGASGAVSAILGGYAITYPAAKVRTLIFVGIPLLLDLPALLVLGFWFVVQMIAGLNLLQGIVEAPVAFWAHIGGFVAGIVLLPFMSLGASPPENDWRKETEDLFNFDEPRSRQVDGNARHNS